MFGPLGTATEVGDELVVNGRWPFSSGAPNAELVQVGIFVMDGDAPRLRPDGLPDWRFAYLRRDEVDVDDTWHAAGLRGTGSHDVVCNEVRIPARRTAMPVYDAAPHDGPLWRLPFFCLARSIMVGFPLGVARRALDEITAIAPTKRRGMSTVTIAEDRAAQVALAHAEGSLQAARAFVFDAIDEMWSIAVAGSRPGIDQERRVTLATQQTMRAAVEAVDTAYRLGGASAVYDTSPLQRCFRDIHAAAQHIIFSDENWIEYASFRLGGRPSP
jgi:indole-3-acetate monooxygenase